MQFLLYLFDIHIRIPQLIHQLIIFILTEILVSVVCVYLRFQVVYELFFVHFLDQRVAFYLTFKVSILVLQAEMLLLVVRVASFSKRLTDRAVICIIHQCVLGKPLLLAIKHSVRVLRIMNVGKLVKLLARWRRLPFALLILHTDLR